VKNFVFPCERTSDKRTIIYNFTFKKKFLSLTHVDHITIDSRDASINPKEKASITDMLSRFRIDPDTLAAGWIVAEAHAASGRCGELKPIKHYREYIENQHGSEVADLTLKLSDPEAVAEFDRRVDEFNANLEKYRKQGDGSAIFTYIQEVKELANSKR